MKAYMFEGSPEEVAQALKAMGTVAEDVRGPAPPTDQPDEGDEADGPQPLPFTVAKRLLTRRPVSGKLKEAIVAVYNAGDDGILGSELAEALEHEQAQFRGMMGAFGRRLVNTEGWEDGMSFFDWSWDDAERSYRYRLFDSSRKAVEAVLLK